MQEDELLGSCSGCMSAHAEPNPFPVRHTYSILKHLHTLGLNLISSWDSPHFSGGENTLWLRGIYNQSSLLTGPFTPTAPLPVKHDKHLLLACRSHVGSESFPCLPDFLTRPCLGSYSQVKTCRLSCVVFLCLKEGKGKAGGTAGVSGVRGQIQRNATRCRSNYILKISLHPL